MQHDRNRCIDTIKGIACIAVVFIHYNYSGEISAAIKAVARFAVPYFFFISGYYLPDAQGNIPPANTKRKIKHILELTCKSAFFYGIFCIYWNSIMDSTWNVWEFTKRELDLGSIIKFIFSCDPFVYAHFWYLLALLWCYLTALIIPDKRTALFYLISFIILICIYSLFAEFSSILGLKNFYKITTNATFVLSNTFLLRGLPFFLFGIFLKKHFLSEFGNWRLNVLLGTVLFGCILSIIEDSYFGTTLMYIGTHITVIALCLISVRYSSCTIPFLEYVGNKLSMYVYIYHIAVGKCFDLLYSKLHLWGDNVFQLLRPILVMGCSVLIAYLIVALKSFRFQTAQVI